ncbi:MAG: hypothetical protein HQK73_02800, partial [Desulfamplus sp.]|nr:hypothetical protein [Desulfamplus sp.]
MVTKKSFIVLFTLMVVFAFTSSVSASDVNKVAEEVKKEIKTDIVKPELK